MPYKNIEKKKEYHREYMGEYNKKHPLTDEQKKHKSEYMKKWVALNKEKVKQARHESYIKNKDKNALRKKEYRIKNKEKIAERKHAYYLKNKEYFAKKAKEYYLNNLDNIREYKNKYAKTSNGRYLTYQVSANKRGHEFLLNKDEFTILITGKCHYCGVDNSNGIDRKNSDIGYSLENSVSCCKICNFMKGTLTYDIFLSHVEKICKTNR